MWFEDLFRKVFNKNSLCSKCNVPSLGKILCEKCERYNALLKKQEKENSEAKDELRRKSWVNTRDKFLEEIND